MRLCLLSREFAPFFGAGIGSYAAAWARALTTAGHEVHVVTRAHPGLHERAAALFPGVQFHLIQPADGPPRLDHNYPYARHSLAALHTVRRLHERLAFDAIEYPEYWAEGHAISQARRTRGDFAGAKLVCRLHMSSALCRELDADRTYPHYAAYLDIMEHESIAHADLVLSPSSGLLESTAARLSHEGWGDIRQGAVLSYPFDARELSQLGPIVGPIVGPIAAESAGPAPTLLCVGRLERRKGQDVLLQACRLLAERGTDFRLVFAGADTGSGPFGRSMRRSLEQRLGALADRVSFTGPLPRNALGAHLGAATLCVFPARWDNFPNALLEAMACGKAVVSTEAGGPGELIEHGVSGLLCAPERPEALAEAIELILHDEPRRRHLGEGAIARIQRCCAPEAVVAEFERRLAEARPRPRPGTSAASPLVSVIVPFYNLSDYLPATLDTVRAQTYANTEVLVIDDGSTEPQADALMRSLDAEGWARVIRQTNTGLSGARNRGLAEARGEFVLPLDADDLLDPSFIGHALGTLRADEGLAYVTSLVAYFRESPRRRFGGWVPLGLHRDLLPVHNCAGCCTAVFRRQSLLDAGGYCTDLTSYEDWDMYCALAERGWHGAVIPDFLISYRIRPDSLLRTEAELRKQHLHAALLARHPDLAQHHTRVQRIMLSESMEAANRSRAGLRYKLADRLNAALKHSPLHGTIKSLAEQALESRRRKRDG
jgi:glycosyltransferase involved in cell wall biosynthesis/GT2 family glycosyltransferase